MVLDLFRTNWRGDSNWIEASFIPYPHMGFFFTPHVYHDCCEQSNLFIKEIPWRNHRERHVQSNNCHIWIQYTPTYLMRDTFWSHLFLIWMNVSDLFSIVRLWNLFSRFHYVFCEFLLYSSSSTFYQIPWIFSYNLDNFQFSQNYSKNNEYNKHIVIISIVVCISTNDH